MLKKVMLAAAVCASMIAQAHAAMVTPEGTANILSNTGRQFSTSSPVDVGAGSRVSAVNRPVTIYYDNGCIERLEVGQSLVVNDNPYCETGAVDYNSKGVLVGGLIVVGVAAGIAAVVSIDDDDDKKKPKSP